MNHKDRSDENNSQGRESRDLFTRTYTINGLGTLGGNDSRARAINNTGHVVGESVTSQGSRHAFIWADGRMLDLGTLGGSNSTARRLNEDGQVVGQADLTGGTNAHAFIWSAEHAMLDLGTLPGGENSSASSINNNGHVVGYSETSSHSTLAFIWNEREGLTKLDRRGSIANDINDSIQIVGWVSSESQIQKPDAAVWQNGQLTRIGFGDDRISADALAINERGQVVGTEFLSAFLWQNGAKVGIRSFSTPLGINNEGVVVGEYRPTVGETNAFIWKDNVFRNLQELLPSNSGWKLLSATDINDREYICGYGLFDRQTHAFVMYPQS